MRGEAMTLLPWPKEADYTEQTPYGPGMNAVAGWDYEHDRAEAALQRLRVAEGLLVQCYTFFAHLQKHTEATELLQDRLHEALEQIGEVPPA
jgi:hypothetical protein